MKVVFLGTNGWYSSPTGDTPCILIDSSDQYIVLDAGNGIYKLASFIAEDKPISLFISHFHLDHVSGLHILNKFDFKQGMDVYVGVGRSRDFETLVNPPFTIGYKIKEKNIFNLKYDVRLQEITTVIQKDSLKVTTFEQKHAYRDHGFRFEVEGKIIVYTGDCGLTESTKKLAQEADLLICECGNKKTLPEQNSWGHMDPTEAVTLAKEAGVKNLILTHFGATLYTSLEDRKGAEQEAQKIFPKTIAAVDGMEL